MKKADNFDTSKWLVENKITKNISESIIDKIKSLFQHTPVESKLLNSLDLFNDNLLSPGEEKFNTVIEKAKKFGMNIDKEQASNIIQKKLAMKIEDLENKITTQSRLNETLDVLQPQNSQEKLLSSPIVSKDNKGNDIKLIGQEAEGVFWDSKGKRYSKSGDNLYTPYELDRYQSVEFKKERAKTHHYFDTLKEEKPTNDMVKDYWSIMVENQPEDVIKILVGLTNGDLPFKKFSLDTANDVYDSFRDEFNEDEF
jgi:hypothetical protein